MRENEDLKLILQVISHLIRKPQSHFRNSVPIFIHVYILALGLKTINLVNGLYNAKWEW